MNSIVTTYPVAVRDTMVERLHGYAVTDPYRWLEEPDAPATVAWSAAQDALWHRSARSLPGRDRFRARINELSGVGMVGEPTWRGRRRFFLRRTAQQDHAVLYVAEVDAEPRILLDPMELDPSGRTTLDGWQPDADGRLLGYQVSRGGTEEAELFVLDVDTGRFVDGPLDRCRYSPVAWVAGGSGFFFVRDGQVRFHRIGAPGDVVVLGEPSRYGLEISADQRWLTISRLRGAANDLWLADLSDGTPESMQLSVVQHDVGARSVATVGRDGRLYVITTLGGASGRVFVARPTDPGPDHWQELVPADPAAPLTDFAILDGPELPRPLLLVGRIRQAASEIHVHDLRSGEWLGTVPLPGLGSVGTMTTHPEGGHEVWFSYTDNTTPGAVHRYDARTGRTTVWAEPPGTVDLADTEAQCLTATSADGTPIAMTVLTRTGHEGPRPTLVYGYGGFGVSLTPTYSSLALGWVEAGGVFVTVNVRGGGEHGEGWHASGRCERKQNVFDDFIAAAEWLVAHGWTTPAQLGMLGESNGGLLVGAVLTQRPELFAAAVCASPVLDMVRYERSGLGPSWVDEFGSASDPDQLGWLLGYSPYHRVRDSVPYPAVLFTVSEGDTRVDPWHARKTCAALQHATTSGRPVLLRVERDVGHGRSAVSRGVALAADTLAFLAAYTGLT
ncbi:MULTISPECIES: prolyl oligopeptidase family serine peptidase [Nocardioides]|uniref:prolyl oligopeptidase n=1 Tax=Nocardioides vastitatis TaxID=2568655 RepID=A0ABW0ZBZ9_9ACTN|nr:prolyl oligopeptidase family serine peptidase [Nocardioides sp.]THI91372.1 S9 family peptidase [Nocardioides sp.]